jgi:hypothetical protein
MIMAVSVLACQAPLYAQQQGDKPAQPKIPVPKVEYTANDARDPFLACAKSQKKNEQAKDQQPAEAVVLPPLAIQGIIWGSSLPQAIVNGKLLTIGDTVAEVTITGISGDGLEVRFKDRPFHISSPASLQRRGGYNAK